MVLSMSNPNTTFSLSGAFRVGLTVAALVSSAAAFTPSADAARTCLEDQPCFVWSKDGNGARGVTLTSGKHRVLTVCAFKRADAAGRIDWDVTPHLKGDSTARNTRCAR